MITRFAAGDRRMVFGLAKRGFQPEALACVVADVRGMLPHAYGRPKTGGRAKSLPPESGKPGKDQRMGRKAVTAPALCADRFSSPTDC